jgi:hypothetical protein
VLDILRSAKTTQNEILACSSDDVRNEVRHCSALVTVAQVPDARCISINTEILSKLLNAPIPQIGPWLVCGCTPAIRTVAGRVVHSQVRNAELNATEVRAASTG